MGRGRSQPMPCTAQVQEAVDALAEAEGGGDSQDLYREHAGPLLERLAESQQGWTVHSPELLQFVALVTHAGEPPHEPEGPRGLCRTEATVQKLLAVRATCAE